jgi:LacI family transcriptional regulator
MAELDVGIPLRGRPTIQDVARHCGLSKATVSKVLNLPEDQCPIAEPTRAKVFASVEALGYRPSWQGRALANRRTQMIAVVNADPYGALPRGQYWEIVDQLDDALAQVGLVPTYIHTYAGNPRAIDMLADQRFDGCLSLDAQPVEVMDLLRRNNTPTVLINADVDTSWNHLKFDDKLGTQLLMQHLISLGHKRIAYNAGRRVNTHSSAIIRAATYAQCMRDAGLEPDRPFCGAVSEFIERAVEGSYKPTAIIDFEHWTAVHVLQHLWRRGLRVPDDISVATFNDTYPVALTVPPLTVAVLPVKQVTWRAIELLTQTIENPQKEPVTEVLAESIVIRESTAAPRADVG